jgi:hypothetical protein
VPVLLCWCLILNASRNASNLFWMNSLKIRFVSRRWRRRPWSSAVNSITAVQAHG